MNSETIANQFARMGARFRVIRPEVRRADYALDLVTDREGQCFELHLSAEREAQLEINVLQCERHDRHLLLLVKSQAAKDRFLCGHDEREWFVAAVPGGASSVLQAKLALQPRALRQSAAYAGLNLRQRTRRHNRAFIRQGEWFFVPMPRLIVSAGLILHNEPINRSGGKPHWVAELYRSGGERVYVCPRFPGGLTEVHYKRQLAQNPKARNWGWEERVRNAGVYARGTVRHRDHATIALREWHQVLMNTESESRTMANVAFLD